MSVPALERMVNQIAGNAPREDDAAQRVAEHLRLFWTPAMLDDLAAAVAADDVTLTPVAAQALALMQRSG